MEGRIAWKGAAGVSLLLLPFPLVPHVEIEFDDASCSWNFRERELIGNESIQLRTPTFLPSLHICKLKFARLIVHGAFSLLDPSTPPLVPIRNLSETEFSDDRISLFVFVWSCDRSIRQGEIFVESTDDNLDGFYGFNLCHKEEKYHVKSVAHKVNDLKEEIVFGGIS